MVDGSETAEYSKRTNMTSGANLMLVRASIVLGMVAAVVTLLYLTPLPDQNFKSCDRPCHDLDWPMICRIRLNIEMFQSNLKCEDCPNNSTKCSDSFCPSSINIPRSIITANRHFPGPAIHVCHNDILMVDVVNKIPDQSISIHWRGQPNNEAPFMDGVPMVTQCPISSYTTFQYKFRASTPGTHFYHAHSDSDRSNGLYGALIVRRSSKLEPHRKQYEVDSKNHMVLLSEWSADPKNKESERHILVNGKVPYGSSLAVFSVTKGKRYRFRVSYVGGLSGCPVTLNVDKHFMRVISLDGNPIKAYEVSSVKLSKGERLDFVLKTSQEPGDYFMKITSNCNEKEVTGMAVVSYDDKSSSTSLQRVDLTKITRKFDTSLVQSGDGEVCLGNVGALDKIDPSLKESDVDQKLYLAFDYIDREIDLAKTGLSGLRTRTYRMNNITFTYPSSPLLTQPDDVAVDLMCNESNLPARCKGKTDCECVHIEHIPLGRSIEIILIDQGGDQEEHIFHLHGYHFYVVGSKVFKKRPSREEVMKMDLENNLIKRNLMNPVLKDTVRVPRNGVVVLRLLANNPGFWMLRDEQSGGWTRGMDLLFQVGAIGDVVSTPSGFPTCRSFIGPAFFLL